ncbi:hypothetical protein FRB99_008725 [Tulasnella sp. 403]|nr:hypothetical protein FRB99_008725 [Tulasnella sp. 403]
MSSTTSKPASQLAASTSSKQNRKTRIVRRRGPTRGDDLEDDAIFERAALSDTDSEPEDNDTTDEDEEEDIGDTDPEGTTGVAVTSTPAAPTNGTPSMTNSSSTNTPSASGTLSKEASHLWSDSVTAADHETKPEDLPVIDFADLSLIAEGKVPAPPILDSQPPRSEKSTPSPPVASAAAPNPEEPEGSSPSAPPAPSTKPKPKPHQSAKISYLKKLNSDPSFTPRVGQFWGHDDRLLDKDLRSMSDWWRGKWMGRGRGRGGRGGFAGRGGGRTPPARVSAPASESGAAATKPAEPNVVTEPERWVHDGFEELMRQEEAGRGRKRGTNRPRGWSKEKRGRGRGASNGVGGSPLPAPSEMQAQLQAQAAAKIVSEQSPKAQSPHEGPSTLTPQASTPKPPRKTPRPPRAKVNAVLSEAAKEREASVSKGVVATVKNEAAAAQKQTNDSPPPRQPSPPIRVNLPKPVAPKQRQPSLPTPQQSTSSIPSAHELLRNLPAPSSSQLRSSKTESSGKDVEPRPTPSDMDRTAAMEKAILKDSFTRGSTSAPDDASSSRDAAPLVVDATLPVQPSSNPSYSYLQLPPGIAMGDSGLLFEIATGRPVVLNQSVPPTPAVAMAPPPVVPMYTPRPVLHSHAAAGSSRSGSVSYLPPHVLQNMTPEYSPTPPLYTTYASSPDPARGTPTFFAPPKSTGKVHIRPPHLRNSSDSRQTTEPAVNDPSKSPKQKMHATTVSNASSQDRHNAGHAASTSTSTSTSATAYQNRPVPEQYYQTTSYYPTSATPASTMYMSPATAGVAEDPYYGGYYQQYNFTPGMEYSYGAVGPDGTYSAYTSQAGQESQQAQQSFTPAHPQGLTGSDYEVSLLRLIERMCNGMIIEISVTGTSILIKPGVIIGGSIAHECPISRSVGYFMEPIIMLAPFAKKPLNLTLTGITTDDRDLSVDLLRTVTLPHLQLFGISEGVELKIKKRGAPPLGGGEVNFMCPIVRQLKTINFVEPGKIKRIRGIAHAVRVSPQLSHRMVEAARSVLNRYIPDIYIHTDVYKGDESGKSPGYALTLLSESTTSAIYSAEGVSQPGSTPEDVATAAARSLLNEIRGRGCVDQKHQCLVMLLMVLGAEDVGRCRISSLSERSIQFLRDIRDVFGTTFKVTPADPSDADSAEVLISCYGTGVWVVEKDATASQPTADSVHTLPHLVVPLPHLMPQTPTTSPATGNPIPEYFIHTTNGHFVDTSGRMLLLRGVNLSGDSKYPIGHNSHTLDGFWETGESGNVSFVGKPFALKEADIHLERLRGWGMNMIRKQYDEEFIDYTIEVLRKCKEHGFKVFIDPHQDVWSRFSGGSGAPFWTLHACGLQPRHFTATGGLLHNEYPDPDAPDPDKFPPMTWPTSYYRLPSLTLFTLFFGGRDFAPKCIIDGVNIQDYLQTHFIDAFGHLADRIRDAGGLLDECVLGWESINEPSEGFIGMHDLNLYPADQVLKRETCPTPAQSLRLGSGIPQTVDYWAFRRVGPMKNGSINIDPKGLTIWLGPEEEPAGVSLKWLWTRDPGWKLGDCIWEQHGVWDRQSGNMSIPDYFKYSRREPGKRIDFVNEYWLPHWKAWATRIRESHPEAIHFLQPPLFKPPPPMLESDIKGRAAYSPHFYDVGDEAIKRNFQDQLALFREDVEHNVGAYPVILGETGTPFDVDAKKSYGRTDGGIHIGNHIQQQTALDASLSATDGSNVYNYTLWAYNPGHSWEHGDGFNGEDLSIWSPDDYIYRRHVKFEKFAKAAAEGTLPSVTIGTTELSPSQLTPAIESSPSLPGTQNLPLPKALTTPCTTQYEFLVDGARAIAAFCRPYPVKTVGKPTHINYIIPEAKFMMTVSVDSSDRTWGVSSLSGNEAGPAGRGLPTEIYIPLTAFASPPTLFPIPGEEVADDQLSARSSPSPRSSPRPGSPKHRSAPSSIHNDRQRSHSVQEAVSLLHLAFAGNRHRAAAGYSLHLSSDPPLPLEIPEDALEVDVTVSAGTWLIKGQTIYWHYDVPEEGRETYTITVQKRNPKVGAVARSGKGDGCCIM